MDQLFKHANDKKNELINEFLKSSLDDANLHPEQDGIELCIRDDNQYWIEYRGIKVSPTMFLKTSISDDLSILTLKKYMIVSDTMRHDAEYYFTKKHQVQWPI